jgi:hypothetical protein
MGLHRFCDGWDKSSVYASAQIVLAITRNVLVPVSEPYIASTSEQYCGRKCDCTHKKNCTLSKLGNMFIYLQAFNIFLLILLPISA